MKILMVCLGNICRSPLAEGILKSKLPEEFTVDSAGTISMHRGSQPDFRSVQTAAAHDIDISQQISRPVTLEDLDSFDWIFCMDERNLYDVQKMAQNEHQRKKIMLLMDAAELLPREVADPYFGEEDGFEEVYQQIDRACTVIAKKLISQENFTN